MIKESKKKFTYFNNFLITFLFNKAYDSLFKAEINNFRLNYISFIINLTFKIDTLQLKITLICLLDLIEYSTKLMLNYSFSKFKKKLDPNIR